MRGGESARRAPQHLPGLTCTAVPTPPVHATTPLADIAKCVHSQLPNVVSARTRVEDRRVYRRHHAGGRAFVHLCQRSFKLCTVSPPQALRLFNKQIGFLEEILVSGFPTIDYFFSFAFNVPAEFASSQKDCFYAEFAEPVVRMFATCGCASVADCQAWVESPRWPGHNGKLSKVARDGKRCRWPEAAMNTGMCALPCLT